MKTDIIKLILKILIAIISIIASYFGVQSLTSCSASRSASHTGTGYFQYYDTIFVDGNYNFVLPKK